MYIWSTQIYNEQSNPKMHYNAAHQKYAMKPDSQWTQTLKRSTIKGNKIFWASKVTSARASMRSKAVDA